MGLDHDVVERDIGRREAGEEPAGVGQIADRRQRKAGEESEENSGIVEMGGVEKLGVDLEQKGFVFARFYERNDPHFPAKCGRPRIAGEFSRRGA